MAKYSIIVPAYNEEKSLHLFYAAVTPLMESLQEEYEMIFVNDGMFLIAERLLFLSDRRADSVIRSLP